MESNFRVSLEYIDSHLDCHIFRVAFESSDDRYLLNYPDVTGLHFNLKQSVRAAEFTTRFVISSPGDEFVLNPLDRIAFDLRAYINVESTLARRWTVELKPGEYTIDFHYSIDAKRRRYDYLGKGSRFADITKPWSGLIVSNTVSFSLPEPGQLLAPSP